MLMILRHRLFLPLLSTLVCISAPGERAHAQTASQITPPTFAPEQNAPSRGRVQLPETQGLNAPEGAEKLFVKPSGVDINGAFAEMEEVNAAIEKRLGTGEISGAEIFAAARDLEVAYAKAGYILARVSVPPQTITDGTRITFIVTDGYIEEIDASAFDAPVQGYVRKLLDPLVGQRRLKRQEIERRLLLAGDLPGLALRSTLRAGNAPGSATLVLNGRFDSVTATVSVDNSVSKELGGAMTAAGLQLNNVIGLGEQFYARVAGYPNGGDNGFLSGDPRNRQLAGGVIIPLHIEGLSLNLEGTDARTLPESDLGFGMSDHFQRFSARLNYDWWRSRDLDLSTNLAFDATRERQTILLPDNKLPFTEDRLRVLRLTQSLLWQNASGGSWNASLTGSFGLDALGARTGTDTLPLSRDGADPDFQKLDLNWRYGQAFPSGWQVTLKGRAQTSFGQALVASEQISLGGFEGLSSYASGRLDGDSGALLRAEVHRPMVTTLPIAGETRNLIIAPYVFAAGGVVKLEEATALESRVTRAASYGLGLQTALSQTGSASAVTLSLEYARGSDSDNTRNNRFNLKLYASF
ncbi:ShlB/FhaC/HecB family hemolysin secretion/activation protein [Rhizobium helianthi]|uniref:ShlB/FhaC/HecB family hemolysin secretion/activation protein n=1 Tax=Rhizobium helianthi TaxID=1132695 RepID=A0ABW4M248_9HYPH